MKIAHIDVNFGHGSTGKIVKTIHDYLIQSGHRSRAYFGRGEETAEDDVIKFSSDFNVIIDAGLSRITGYTGIFSSSATDSLIADLDIFQPDVVHLHELHGYYVNYFRLLNYLKERRIPIVWTLHCEYTYTGRCGYAYECDQWKTLCVRCPHLKDYPKSWLFDRSQEQFSRKHQAINELDSIIFAPVSNWLHERLKQSFLKERPARVVYNGIDSNKLFIPRDVSDMPMYHQLKGRFIVLSVAPDIMTERKGGNWVLEIARRMNAMPITFILIGVNKKIPECPSNVIQLPLIRDQVELSRYYSLANFLLITSKRETFSLVCAESLACGTPVVGFDSGGPLEVAPVPYGHFVTYGNIESLVSLVSDAYTGILEIASHAACVEHVKNNFDNAHMINNYVDLYHASINMK